MPVLLLPSELSVICPQDSKAGRELAAVLIPECLSTPPYWPPIARDWPSLIASRWATGPVSGEGLTRLKGPTLSLHSSLPATVATNPPDAVAQTPSLSVAVITSRPMGFNWDVGFPVRWVILALSINKGWGRIPTMCRHSEWAWPSTITFLVSRTTVSRRVPHQFGRISISRLVRK